MLSTARMFIGAVLLAVIGIIVWSYITGARPAARTAPRATSTPPVVVEKKPSVPEVPAPLSARVSVATPVKGATVGSTFTVKGKAPGNWFFEASFPIQVRDPEGNVVGRAISQAQGEWMTTELVAFTTEVVIEGGYSGPATLILLRDNPSGLPEHDDALEIDIIIK